MNRLPPVQEFSFFLLVAVVLITFIMYVEQSKRGDKK